MAGLEMGTILNVTATICISESLLSQTEKEPTIKKHTIFKSLVESNGREFVVFFVSNGFGCGAIIKLIQTTESTILFPNHYLIIKNTKFVHDSALCSFLLDYTR